MATTQEPQALLVTSEAALSEKTAALAVQDDGVPGSSTATSVNEAPIATQAPNSEQISAFEPTQEDIAPTKPISKPIPHPLPTSKPQPLPALTADHEKKYADLLAQVKSWTEIPTSATGTPIEPINDTDRLWLTRDCLLRYLRATKWNVPHAADRLKATLIWHREFGLRSKLTADYVSPENETGKQTIMGFDIHGRPCLFLDPGKQNTDFKTHGDRQTAHLVFMLEKVIDLLPPGQESMALLINYKDTSTSKNPPMSQSRGVLHILQTYYPERLGRAMINDLPWYVTTFYKLISPFLDPVTKSKMKFNEKLVVHVPPEQLLAQHGGNVQFKYDHSVYWPALNELGDRRRKHLEARWEKAGKQIGEHEAFLRGGDATSLDGRLNGKDLPEGFALVH